MSASDAPRREPGLRSRSGNAMLRTRGAILDAAAVAVAEHGVRATTMAKVAAAAGIAKATLYNHFRTKDDVLAALVEAQVRALGEQCAARAAEQGLAAALEHAAEVLSRFPALRRVAADEPAALLPLLVPGEGRGWAQARTGVAEVLTAGGGCAGPAEVDLVLRWLLSALLWPGSGASAAVLAGRLDPGASAASGPGRGLDDAHPTGLGWPDTLRTR